MRCCIRGVVLTFPTIPVAPHTARLTASAAGLRTVPIASNAAMGAAPAGSTARSLPTRITGRPFTAPPASPPTA